MRFSCDAMLGSLARWLRFAGFDAAYRAHVPDEALAAQARAEGRWLLTRDRPLASLAGPRVLLLASAAVAGQVAELRSRLGLAADPGRFFTRCSRCNAELEALDRAEAAGLVPPYVATHAERFVRCMGCGRVYWPGTHSRRIARQLERLWLNERL